MSPQANDQEIGSPGRDTPQQDEGGERRLASARRLVAIFWYLLGLWAALALVARVVGPAWQSAGSGLVGWATIGQGMVVLLLLAVGFVLVDQGWRAAWRWAGTAEKASSQAAAGKEATPATAGRAFPTPPTLQIGVGVLSFSALSLSAVVALLYFGVGSDVRQAVLMTCAAGVGSSIATILGFLEHASEKADFNPAYAPWYVGRPVMGLLLGLLFFLVLRGGMLGVLPNLKAAELNPYGLAAVGGLVGLFTKHAVEKLQEVFDVLFQTKSDLQKGAAAAAQGGPTSHPSGNATGATPDAGTSGPANATPGDAATGGAGGTPGQDT